MKANVRLATHRNRRAILSSRIATMLSHGILVAASLCFAALLPLASAHSKTVSTTSTTRVTTSTVTHSLVGYPTTHDSSLSKRSTKSSSTHTSPPSPTKYGTSSSKSAHTSSKSSSTHGKTSSKSSSAHHQTSFKSSTTHHSTSSKSSTTHSKTSRSTRTTVGTVSKPRSSDSIRTSSGSIALCSVYVTTTAITTKPASPITATTTTTYTGFINGDDGLPLCGTTLTYTGLSVVYSSTYAFRFQATVSTATPADPTTTIPAPTNVIPVRKSYPKAGYAGCVGGPNPVDKTCPNPVGGFGQKKKRNLPRAAKPGTCTITSTSTTTTGVPSTVTTTTTVTDPTVYIIFPQEGISTPYDECTVYTTQIFTTSTSTGYSTTVYVTETGSPTTLPRTTRTVNAACAETNFADIAPVSGNTVGPINGIGGYLENSTTIDKFFTSSAYECCLGALSSGFGAWEFTPGVNSACRIFTNRYHAPENVCGPQSADQYNILVGERNGTQRVVGNGLCGEVTGSTT
nr:hypothetical protein CFP56_50343 [Quercus suber]